MTDQNNLSYLATVAKFARDRLTDLREAPASVRSQAEREHNAAAQAYAKAFFASGARINAERAAGVAHG